MNLQQLQKWRTWIETIRTNVGHAYMGRTIYRDVVRIVQTNSAIDQNSLFFGYFTNNYIDALVMAIRRQVKQRDSVSLAALLADLEGNAPQFTRAWFYSLYEGSTPEHIMARDFGRFAGPEGPHVDSSVVRADLEALKAACQSAEEYGDRRVAHWDPRAPRFELTGNALDEALDAVGLLVGKYYLLLFCAGLDIHPIPQGPVYHIFSVPWLHPQGPRGGV